MHMTDVDMCKFWDMWAGSRYVEYHLDHLGNKALRENTFLSSWSCYICIPSWCPDILCLQDELAIRWSQFRVTHLRDCLPQIGIGIRQCSSERPGYTTSKL